MMETNRTNRIKIKDSDIKAILFRNFAGAPDRYNPNGCMANFWIVLNDEDRAKELEDQRLNIRWKPNRDGDMEPRLQLFIRWDKKPPKIFQKAGDTEVLLNEDTVSALDYADILHADLILSPHEYDPVKPMKAYIHLARFVVEDEDWND